MDVEHEMELIRNDAQLLEWQCPDCGRHCCVHLQETPVRLEILEKGDQFARHSGSHLLSAEVGPVGTTRRH